jgi:hypothetical protein
MSDENCITTIKTQSQLRNTEAVRANEASKLDAHKAAEKKDFEPWYFTHI